nr:integrase, catalytic region, zinc finger, CCHC-type, peptidase aspartic, catalytic [Tanacetum cinerariifolium]
MIKLLINKIDDFGEEYQVKGRIVAIKSHLNAIGITAAHIDVNTAQVEVVQIVLWYLDSGCSKHMIGNRSQLMNFVSKFLGTVRFRNDQIAKIMGYGDCQLGNVTISRVKESSRKGQNQNKTVQKREAWRSREMPEAVTVDRARKTEENKKRMNENANEDQKLLNFKEKKQREGPYLQFSQSSKGGTSSVNSAKDVPQGPRLQLTIST